MKEKLKVLELFAGSRSFGKEAERQGCEVFSVDIKPFEGIDLVKDIMLLTPEDIPFVPDLVVGSPVCTTYSVAAISHHRDGAKPKTEFAELSDKLVKKTLALIQHYDCAFFLENPRGMLRKMPFMLGIPKATVWYCQYGDHRAKPTDIFSNSIYSLFSPEGWLPRPVCRNNNPHCHHDRAPRSSYEKGKGTQGLSNNYERSKIPVALCREIIESQIKAFKK